MTDLKFKILNAIQESWPSIWDGNLESFYKSAGPGNRLKITRRGLVNRWNRSITNAVRWMENNGWIEQWRDDGDVDYYLITVKGKRKWFGHVMTLPKRQQKKYGVD